MEVPSLLETRHRGSHSRNRRVAGARDHPKEFLGPEGVAWIGFIFPGKHRRSDDNLTWLELRIQPAAYAKAYNAAHTFSDGIPQKKRGPVTISDHRCHPGYSGLN